MKESQILISYLQERLATMGYEWENILDDKSQYLYIPNKENPSIVIRIANHICSMWEFTKNVKPSNSVRFISVVFKEEDYIGNNSGLWNAKGEEIIFEDIEQIFNEWWLYLDIILQDIVNYINNSEADYKDSTSLASVVPLKVERLVKMGGKLKLSWNGVGEDPMIAYQAHQKKKTKDNNGNSNTSSSIPSQTIKESKNYKNMKKNVQRINESQLRAIVAESVKKVLLNEGLFDKKYRDGASIREYLRWKHRDEGIFVNNKEYSSRDSRGAIELSNGSNVVKILLPATEQDIEMAVNRLSGKGQYRSEYDSQRGVGFNPNGRF